MGRASEPSGAESRGRCEPGARDTGGERERATRICRLGASASEPPRCRQQRPNGPGSLGPNALASAATASRRRRCGRRYPGPGHRHRRALREGDSARRPCPERARERGRPPRAAHGWHREDHRPSGDGPLYFWAGRWRGHPMRCGHLGGIRRMWSRKAGQGPPGGKDPGTMTRSAVTRPASVCALAPRAARWWCGARGALEQGALGQAAARTEPRHA